MSKRNNRNQPVEATEENVVVEEVKDEEQVDEIPVEIVEEKKPNKVLSVLRKAAPIVVLGGIIATAFALGHHSGTDAACLAMLNDEYGDSGDKDETSDDESEEEKDEGDKDEQT